MELTLFKLLSVKPKSYKSKLHLMRHKKMKRNVVVKED